MINLDQFKLTPQEQAQKLRKVPVEEFKTDKNQQESGGAVGAVTGFAKGVLSLPFEATELGKSLAYGMGKGLQKIPFAPLQSYGKKITDYQEQGKAPEILKNLTQQPEILKPKGTAENLGYGAEQIGEFFLPTGLEAKGVKYASKILPKLETGISKIDKIVKGTTTLGAKSIASGTEFAGKQALQTSDFEATKQSGMIGLLTPPTIKGITTAANKVAPVAASVLAEMIGKEPDHIIQAFKNPYAVAKKMAEKTIPLQVREKAINSLKSFKSAYSTEFEQGLEKLQKNTNNFGVMYNASVRKGNQSLMAEGWLDSVRSGLVKELRKLRISVLDNGKTLDFSKLNSSVTSSGESRNLQKIWDTINEQSAKNITPKDVQAVAARINSLINFEKGTKTVNSLAAGKIHSAYGEFIKDLYPDLYKLRKSFSTSQQIYSGIDEILKSVKNEIANPTATTTSTKKLSNVFAEDNEAYLNAIKRLEEVSGVDLLNDLAASEFRLFAPRKFGSVMQQAGVLGSLAGGAMYNPMIFAALPLFSPNLMGRVVTTAGKSAPYAKEVLKSIPKIFMPSIK